MLRQNWQEYVSEPIKFSCDLHTLDGAHTGSSTNIVAVIGPSWFKLALSEYLGCYK